MAIGVDPGKINDHTVVCVARSVRIDLPEFIADREGVHSMDGVPEDRHFEPVAQPESTVDGSHYVGSEGWFRDQDEQQKRAVAGAPGTGPLALTPTVRPVRRRRDEPQPGCAEWFELEREKARFAGRLNGRDATAAEAAEHENNLKTIREKHAV